MDGGSAGALRKNSREKRSSPAPTCSPRAPPNPRQKVINAATEASALGKPPRSLPVSEIPVLHEGKHMGRD